MSIRSTLPVIAAVATTALAMPLERRQISYNAVCDAARTPEFNDCQVNFDNINSVSGGDASYMWPLPENYPNAGGTTWYNGDCEVTIYWSNGQPIPNNLVVDGINQLESQCQSHSAGGIAYNNDGSMAVSIYAPGNPPEASRVITLPAEKEKRQDNSYTNAYTIENSSPQEYWQQVFSALPGGSSWSITDEQTQTSTFESTTEISADLFSLFSASQSISFGQEDSYSHSVTQSITNNCANDQQGYLYWTPLFTQYHGGFTGGPSPVDLYVPVADGDGNAAGNYVVQCTN